MINKKRSKKWKRKKELWELINLRRLISLTNSSWYWLFDWVSDTRSWQLLWLCRDSVRAQSEARRRFCLRRKIVVRSRFTVLLKLWCLYSWITCKVVYFTLLPFLNQFGRVIKLFTRSRLTVINVKRILFNRIYLLWSNILHRRVLIN
jgi:hypothetical protein